MTLGGMIAEVVGVIRSISARDRARMPSNGPHVQAVGAGACEAFNSPLSVGSLAPTRRLRSRRTAISDWALS